MASFRKHRAGWRVEVCVKGIRKSHVCDTKGRARAWAEDQERRLSGWLAHDADSKTLGDAFAKYAMEVSPNKKGARWEIVRLKRLQRAAIAEIALPALTPSHLAKWRDSRLQEVSAGSVRREMALMAGVFSYCTKEWGWLDRSPLALVRKPPSPPHRWRRISPQEEAALLAELPPTLRVLFQLALETGMRLGEICNLQPTSVLGGFLAIEDTKNGSRRDVPLSRFACHLLLESGHLLPCSSAYVSREFGLACKRAGIKDLHFHDTRHEACTRLASKLTVMELARMIGHRDLRSLMIYYNPTPSEIADKLD